MLRKLFLWSSVTLLAFLLLLNSLTYFFNTPKFKQYFLNAVNDNISKEFNVSGKLHVSFIDKFPLASFTLTSVRLQNALNPEDLKVLEVGKISLLFNWLDIINGNYEIKTIIIQDGYISLEKDERGHANYFFWEKDIQEKTDSAVTKNENNYKLVLDDVILKNVLLTYTDKKDYQQYIVIINESNLSGEFSQDEYTLDLEMDMDVQTATIGSSEYLDNKHIKLTSTLKVSDKNQNYLIDNSQLKINGEPFLMSGFMNTKDRELRFNLQKEEGDIRSFLSLLPPKYSEHLKDFSSTGKLGLSVLLDGDLDQDNGLNYEVRYKLLEGSIQHPKLPNKLERVSFNGRITNGSRNSKRSSLFELNDFKAMVRNKPVNITCKVLNFENPLVDIKADAHFDLADIVSLIDSGGKWMGKASGQIEFDDFSFLGRVTKSTSSLRQFNESVKHGSGKVILTDVNWEFGAEKLKGINGILAFSNDDIHFDNVSVNYKNSDVTLDLKVKRLMRNLLYAVASNSGYSVAKIAFKGKASAKNLDVNDLLSNNTDSTIQNDSALSTTSTFWWDYLDGSIDIDVNQLSYDAFFADNIRGALSIDGSDIYFNNLEFKTADGIVKGNGNINLIGLEGLQLNASVLGEQLNVKKLFTEFNNFGQSNLLDENLDGDLFTNTKIKSLWLDNYSLVEDSLYVLSDITISHGKLINYEPLEELSTFVKLKDLRNVEFSDMSNQVEIKDRIVHVPTMLMSSNAAIFSLSGQHTFDNYLDYKLKVSLSDIIAKRFKNNNKDVEDFEDETSGRLNIYLQMIGHIDDFKIKYDKKAVKEKIKDDLGKERQELREVLKKEFSKEYKPHNEIEDWEDDEIEFIDN